MRLAIVVPVLDEGAILTERLRALQTLRAGGAELIVVDGGSSDDSRTQALALADTVLCTPRGRALQMNAGAAAASPRTEALLFLHADTRLPAGADALIAAALNDAPWGRFDVRIDSTRRALRVVAFMMNWRSRATGICTGDQALFMQRDFFRELGGFAAIELMEDIELSCRARRRARPAVVKPAAVTSGRRWEANGVLRTILLMWELRLRYFLGADPAALARRYRAAR